MVAEPSETPRTLSDRGGTPYRVPDPGDAEQTCSTFTCRLPFPIGVVSEGTFDIWVRQAYEVPAADDSPPFVRLRFWNAPTSGMVVWPPLLKQALRTFYGVEIDIAGDSVPKWGENEDPIEQWVTMETPSRRLVGDDADDKGFAFHRSLYFLNVFLRGFAMSYPSSPARPVTPNDLSFVMAVGTLRPGREWTFDMPMLMHPENLPPFKVDPIEPDERFRWAMSAMADGHPFLGAMDWWQRAERALQRRGDTAECVVNLQTATEMLLFDVWRMLLTDLGRTAAEIEAATGGELRLKSVVTTTMPSLVGGTWDVTAIDTVVGTYWRCLYLLRNLVVHAGYEPARREADDALQAFYALRDYLSERIYARRDEYPRTLLSRVGLLGMEKRGWLTTNLRTRLESIMTEPVPYFWPIDYRQPADTER